MRFRTLTDEFRRFLDGRGVWPLLKQFPRALEDKGGGRKADITRMKAGGTVPEKYVLALVELLRGKPALGEFLAMQGVADPGGSDANQLVEHVAGPVQSQAGPLDGDADQHMKGIDALLGLFTDFVWGKLIRSGTLCEHEADVRTAIALTMASIGRTASGDTALSAKEAIQAAERHMRIGHDDYLGRAIALWRVARWSIAFAVVDRQRVGCSIVLPLAEPAYEALRLGVRDSHACSPADLALPSRTLFLEAIAHRADAEYPAVHRKTGQLVRTIYVQLAVLSLDGPGPLQADRPLRILSIAGNPTNAKRLRRSGFRPTGTTMPGFDVGLMELDQRKAWWTPAIVRKLQERLLAGDVEF